MILMLLISFAFGQTGGEPPILPGTVAEWCIENAKLKKQLVNMVTCRWEKQVNAYAIPSIPGKRYVCKKYDNAITPSGFEGQLVCPNPFGGLDKDGNPDTVFFKCAVCYTSNTSTGTPDDDCKESMYQNEIGMCTNGAAEMRYEHRPITGLAPGPTGEVPSMAEQNTTGTPAAP